MSDKIFPTAQDAENAFYEALESRDLDAMMSVWAEDEEILCVHPLGPRLTGQDQVRESWAKIFAGEPAARVHVSQQVAISGMMIAVHNVQENFTLPLDLTREESRAQQVADSRPAPIVATNIYLRTGAGWRMIVHHASPAPGEAEAPKRATGLPKTLH